MDRTVVDHGPVGESHEEFFVRQVLGEQRVPTDEIERHPAEHGDRPSEIESRRPLPRRIVEGLGGDPFRARRAAVGGFPSRYMNVGASHCGDAGLLRAKERRTEMDEFKMSAFARYPDGSSGDAFAAVSTRSLVTCFGAMAAEVASWLPQALARGEDEESPQAIELTLEWSGASAQAPAPDGPEAPSDPARRNGRPRRPGLSCATRRRLGCAGVVALSLPTGDRGGFLGTPGT